MTFNTSTLIRGPSLGTPEALAEWAIGKGAARPDDVRSYLATMHRLCTSHGLAFHVAVAQSIHETTDLGKPWNSYWWRGRCNPAGIGITADTRQNAVSRDFGNGEHAARAQFLHLWLYAVGATVPTGLATADDPRWDAAVRAGYAGIADTIGDLANRWAADPRYGEKIARTLNELDTAGLLDAAGGQETSSMATPTIYDLRNDTDAKRFGLTPAQRDRFMQGCFRDRSGARPRAIFCHVQEGSTRGSLKWAIEKSGSQNSYTATVQLDGTILLCIPEEHGPWTNGAVRSPKAKAKKLLNLGGNPNIYTLSIEAEGYWNKTHPQVQIDAIYWLVMHWSAKYDIPVLGDDSAGDWLFEHADVDNVQRTNCAGPYYDTIQKMVREGAKVDPPKPTPIYASIVPIPILDDISSGPGIAPTYVFDPKTELDFWWSGDTYRVVKQTRQRRFATLDSAVIGPDLKVGNELTGDWVFRNQDGRWIYTPDGVRIFADDVIRISDRKAA
jgi:hypothetical protein